MNKAIERLEIVKRDLKEVIEDRDTYSDVCLDIDDILAELQATQAKLDSLREYCVNNMGEWDYGETYEAGERNGKHSALSNIIKILDEGKGQ